MTIKDKSLQLAAISFLADEAKKAKDRLREELKADMDELGADRIKAEIGEETIAYISTSKPKFKWVVQNERKFVDWVKANIPSEIVESVRESSIDAILGKFNYEDDAVIDPNGEVIDWLVGVEAEPYLVTKFHADGRETLRGAILSNSIDTRKILELE